MSAPEPMAVEAPSFTSGPITTASHAPQVNVNVHGNLPDASNGSDSEDDVPLVRKSNGNGHGAKRAVGGGSGSSSDEKPLTKKPRVSAAGAGAKKRRVVESDSDSDAGPSRPTVVKAEPPAIPTANGSASTSASAKPNSKPQSKPKAPLTPSGSELSEDEVPLSAKKPKPQAKPRQSNGAAAKKKPVKQESESEDEEEDEESEFSESSEDEKPLAKKKAAAAKPRKSAASTSKREESSDDDKPLAKKVAKPRKSNGSAGNGAVKKEVKAEPESSEDDKPLAKQVNGAAKKAKVSVKAEKQDKKPSVKREKKVKEEEERDQYKWWEEQANDGSVKWTTFHHRGILFPPPYVPLPKGVKMKYGGTPLTLPHESEEVAGFFAAMLETDHAQDPTFRENFFKGFTETLAKYPPKEGIKVKSLDKCDFRPMFEHFEAEKEKKKAMTKEEKKAIKEAREALEKPYVHAYIDGREEKCGNFRAEPPGLFRGRGDHPRKGTLKHRLRPEDITLNLSKDAPVPVPNIPGQWKGVQHDNTVTWLATWKENVNNQIKYVFLSASSSWKGQSDRMKFEKARELIKHIDKIRKDYTEGLKSKVMADRQRSTAMYFIDRLALRAGNEKGDDEADTPPNKVIFDFLGKDSMRFHQEVEVDAQVFKNIKLFKAEPKQKGDDLFDRLNTGLLNKHLSTLMPGLSAKVFRTYNASWTFQQQLENTPENGTTAEKIAAYNTANREVAILCNHQKTVSKGFSDSFAKMGDKLRALKYQRMKLRYQLFTIEPKLKKKRPDLAEDESDLDDEFLERHEADLLEKALEGAKKKWEKDNIKLEEQSEAKKPKSELDDRLKEIKSEFKELAKERKTKKVEPRRGATEEKLLDQITKMDERIATFRIQMGDRDKLKDVALGTSKINYIDPRITVAWCKKYEVPIEKMFSKTLREKFPWAEAEADEDWVF